MGIVKKNSILLVEFTNQLRHEDGLSVREALLRAAPIRLRPILMTSLATMGAALPLALGFGPGAEARRPLAIAVLGGVGVSTLFTLFVVPCAYSLLAFFEGKTPTDEEEETPPVPPRSDRPAGAPAEGSTSTP
jgi:multidrug efflux pump subunit AcrB